MLVNRMRMLVWMVIACAIVAAWVVQHSTGLISVGLEKRQPITRAGNRLVAIGDLHGDLEAFQLILQEIGVDYSSYPMTYKGDSMVLIQTGDCVDRGIHARAIYELLDELELVEGIRVVRTLGNHELMNMVGDFRYVSDEELELDIFQFLTEDEVSVLDEQLKRVYRGFEPGMLLTSNMGVTAVQQAHPGVVGDYRDRRKELEMERKLEYGSEGSLGKRLVALDAAVVESGVLFAHAGIELAVAKAFDSLSQLNEAVRKDIKGVWSGRAQSALLGPRGPFWTRVYSVDNPTELAKSCASLDEVLSIFKAKKMVIGHTVFNEGIEVRCGGKLVIIDTGMSHAYGGPLSYLEKTTAGELLAWKRPRENTVPFESCRIPLSLDQNGETLEVSETPSCTISS